MVKRKLTDEDILSLPDLYSSGLSSLAIAEIFDTYHSTILHHLKKLNFKRRNRSSAAKEGIKSGRIKIERNEIPRNLVLNEDLAYILGVLAGDGYLDYNNKIRAYCIGLSAIDEEFVEEFKKTLFNVFKIKSSDEFRKSRKEKWNAQYVTRLCSKEACDFINSVGEFKKYNWMIPEIIKNANTKTKCAFIKGFFDSEGEIDKRTGRVGATSMNLEGLKEIGDLLNGLSIRNTIIKVKDNRLNTHQKYRIRIHDKNSIGLFAFLIGFTIARKQKILNNYLSKNSKDLSGNKDLMNQILISEDNIKKGKIKELRY
jgi:intein-encoded DNA endonuclease-like protein